MHDKSKKGQIQLSEELMKRGWWAEAERAISSPELTQSTKTLQKALLAARMECVEWINSRENDEITPRDLLAEFDRYTVYWVLNDYCGEDVQRWRLKSAKVNGLTD